MVTDTRLAIAAHDGCKHFVHCPYGYYLRGCPENDSLVGIGCRTLSRPKNGQLSVLTIIGEGAMRIQLSIEMYGNDGNTTSSSISPAVFGHITCEPG